MIPEAPHPVRSAGSVFGGDGRGYALRRFRSRVSNSMVYTKASILPQLKEYWNDRLLDHKSGAARPLAAKGVVAVTPFYGNDSILPCFLDHHRRLGVDEFVFLDLSGEGRLARQLRDQPDCAVWRPRDEADPGQAIYWLNFLRRRYATGRWCLSLEPSDLFVFARSESRKIKDLIDFLETEHRDHIYAVVVEMYGDRPAAGLNFDVGENPLDRLPYFDPFGYWISDAGQHHNVHMRGGVQRRTLFADAPARSPSLSRIPLVKWRRFHAYVAGTRLMIPARLNTPHSDWHSSPTACLLRFALLDPDASLAMAAAAEGREILSDGGGSSFDAVPRLRRRELKQPSSHRFTASTDLVNCGLLNPGQWF